MRATSTSTARRDRCAAARAISISVRRSFGCSNFYPRSRAECCARPLDGIWGEAAKIDERTVSVHVGRLRKRLSGENERDPIRTVRGTGYTLDETFGKR
jgi:hypothetical protein